MPDDNSNLNWCECLYEQKAAQLVLYGRALGLSHGEAEDVVQETFMTLMVRPAQPDQPEHYLVRSFRNRALNFRRGLWRRLTRELESIRWFERAPGETDAERAAMDCLAQLPASQREIIVLKIWHQLSFEAIGDLLAISPNTAAGRYRYGIQKMKARLTGIAYEKLESIGGRTAGSPFGVLETTPPVAEA